MSNLCRLESLLIVNVCRCKFNTTTTTHMTGIISNRQHFRRENEIRQYLRGIEFNVLLF